MFQRMFAGEGGTYLDIGANIGLTTIPIAQNRMVRCLAFEPEPVNVANLRENIRRNVPEGNVEIHQIALFDRMETLKFGLNPGGNLGDHRVVLDSSTDRRTISIEAFPLDSLDIQVRRPLGVKIDTQGAEPFVIRGGRKLLSQADLCVMEYDPALIARMGGDPAIVVDFVGEFSQVALLPGDVDAEPEFASAADACRRLRNLGADPEFSHRGYVDILASRLG
jgi:FkbM family methyltransferase